MRLLGAVAAVFLGLLPAVGAAAGDTLPAFDIAARCRRIGTAAAHNYSIELLCKQQEEAARLVLATISVEPDIDRYCRSLAEAAGGSYDLMLGCVGDEETAARQVRESATDDQTRARCAEIAAIAGGSNVILLDCIEDSEAAARLSQ
jgi:hypothetical protein